MNRPNTTSPGPRLRSTDRRRPALRRRARLARTPARGEEATPGSTVYLLALYAAGRYAYAIASAFLYLISAAALLFAVAIAIRRLTLWEFAMMAIPLVILAAVIGTSKLMSTPYDFGRPLLVDNLLDQADSFPALLPFGLKNSGTSLSWLVGFNTIVALIPVAMVLIALFALSIRPPQSQLTIGDLKQRLIAIRCGLGFGSAILVAAVLASKELLEWPLKLLLDSQAAALKPIADALTQELGATGTIALIAAFAPAIAAWTLDVGCYREANPDAVTQAKSQPSANKPKEMSAPDGLVFASLSTVTSIIAMLAPILASPFVDALKSILAAIPGK
jgi:hypothetical protein